jgi:CheY-like chemotaxis protein
MTTTSILVADDDDAFREALCRALRAAGHAVEEAADGTQALRILAADTPALLITDLIMPNQDGIELVITAKQAHPGVRILAISGRASFGPLDLLSLAAKLGADATLAKPFSTEQLLDKVAELMGPPPSPA